MVGKIGVLLLHSPFFHLSGQTLGTKRYRTLVGQHHIGHAKQRQLLSRVLCQTAIAALGMPEQVLTT
jgi:hypothetical protein